MFKTLFLRLMLLRARLIGDDHLALAILEEILMADFTAFDAALDRVVAKASADASALADAQTQLTAAQTDAANLQAEIDARTAKLNQVAPA